MKCPVCKEISLSMSERNGVEIDFCPECRGVWLDRGELDKIIEKVNENTKSAGTGMPNYNQVPVSENSQQQYYKHKRKKSFLEEIFD